VSAFFKIASLVFFSLLFASGQRIEPAKTQIENAPRFEDYSVAEIFQGTPAAPLLITPGERLYRTRIRNGVSKGDGVEREGKEQPGPNFAGHFIVITWGCGSPCIMMAIVDALTGRVYGPPMGDGFQMSWLGGGPWLPLAEFRQNSLLMVMRPSPAMADGPIYDHYFIWRDNRWRLVHRTLVDPKKTWP
jgi:hypothetical protein